MVYGTEHVTEYGTEYEPADILIYVHGRGLVLNEKSLVAYDPVSSKIEALGSEAARYAGNAQGNLRLISPLHQGAVADYMAAVKLFAFLIEKALGKKPLRKPGVAVCIPKGSSEVDKKAIEDAIYQAGAGKFLFSEISAEQYMREFQEKYPKEYRKFPVVIGITKADPERYVKEQLAHAIAYAAQEGISSRRVAEMMQEFVDF